MGVWISGGGRGEGGGYLEVGVDGGQRDVALGVFHHSEVVGGKAEAVVLEPCRLGLVGKHQDIRHRLILHINKPLGLQYTRKKEGGSKMRLSSGSTFTLISPETNERVNAHDW